MSYCPVWIMHRWRFCKNLRPSQNIWTLQEPRTSLIVPSKLTLIVRLEQYADQAKKGLFTPSGFPKVTKTEMGAWMVDGNGGFGITALKIGVDKVIAHYI